MLTEILEEESAVVSFFRDLRTEATVPRKALLPFERSREELESTDMSVLVSLRRSHETERSRLSGRTRAPTVSEETSLQLQITREMHARMRKKQDMAVGTGLGRSARWRDTDSTGKTLSQSNEIEEDPLPSGNTYNAAVVAGNSVKQVRHILRYGTNTH